MKNVPRHDHEKKGANTLGSVWLIFSAEWLVDKLKRTGP
jgi:hypothetical protein